LPGEQPFRTVECEAEVGRVDDAERAREALDEVRSRQQQVSTMVTRRMLPWWYAAGVSALVIGQAVVLDLELQDPSRVGWQFRYGVFMVAALLALFWGVRRSMGLRPRDWAVRDANARLLTAVGVYLVVWIAVGTVMRGLDLPWDQTTGAVCGVVAVWVVDLVRRRRAERSGASRGRGGH
jgi:hypothetical protein